MKSKPVPADDFFQTVYFCLAPGSGFTSISPPAWRRRFAIITIEWFFCPIETAVLKKTEFQ